ncbi:hypothetical protein M9Y10_021870 [Tritrichomonas musculus]|uniref:Uncharacterized protein n=1 Tax=Tritrichomonas musculus TaxID=1915356 RepID=A0ABR2KRJ3_9EUKA
MITIWRFNVTDEKLREERNHDWKLIMSRLCPKLEIVTPFDYSSESWGDNDDTPMPQPVAHQNKISSSLESSMTASPYTDDDDNQIPRNDAHQNSMGSHQNTN